MRALLAACILAIATPALAQSTPLPPADGPRECYPNAQIDKVVVRFNDGSTVSGALLCLGPAVFTVARTLDVGTYSLAGVREVRKAADPVWDGALKGAAVALIPLVMSHGRIPANWFFTIAGTYGLFGLTLDAIDTHRDVVYRPSAGKRIGVGFHIPL